ncbi:MAG: DNA/RNA nuclease SfsA [Candidatus Bathyarchaeia archaeon]
MRIRGKTVTGTFQKRPNRFLALVRVNGTVVPCFLPNPGRLHELLVPDVKVILKEAPEGDRKTPYDLIGVWANDHKISVDSRVPNQLLLEALRNQELEEFSMYRVVKPEWSFGHTRFDFLLTDGVKKCLLEAKSCTLVEGGRALFPDAPTERGRRHPRPNGSPEEGLQGLRFIPGPEDRRPKVLPQRRHGPRVWEDPQAGCDRRRGGLRLLLRVYWRRNKIAGKSWG